MEELKKFLTNPLVWLGGIAAGIAAFFAGRASAPANTDPSAPKPAASSERVLYKTGGIDTIKVRNSSDKPVQMVPVEESAAHFTVAGEQYRLIAFTDAKNGMHEPRINRVTDRKRLDDALNGVSLDPQNPNKLVIDEAKFLEGVKIAEAKQKADQFIPIKLVMMEPTKPGELKGTGYENEAGIYTVTVEGQLNGAPLRRKMIMQSSPDITLKINDKSVGVGRMIGAYHNNKPVFSDAAVPMEPNKWLGPGGKPDEELLKDRMEEYVRDSHNHTMIQEFLRRISDNATPQGENKPIRGLDIEQLSKNIPSYANPNATLPQMASIPSAAPKV